MKALSEPQLKFLRTTARGPNRTPFLGNRNAGRAASAWYRTAYSLNERGLVTMDRTGDAYTCNLTDAGRKALTEAS